jgi:hypothetical protein
MILTIVAILIVLWLLGFTVFHLGAFIHLLIIVAVVVFVWDHLVKGRRV